MKELVIVAHGSPSHPEGPDRVLAGLAESVQRLCPEARVRSATLARPGSLAQALAPLHSPTIYPFFMADGWFTRRELPRRLAELQCVAPIMPPFGLDPDLPQLIATELAETGASQVILAAHGSARARNSKDSADAMAARLERLLPGTSIAVGLIEEPPFLRDTALRFPQAVCLPFFAMRAGHVETDIPQALSEAGFGGRLLAPIGESPLVAGLIAAALRRA